MHYSKIIVVLAFLSLSFFSFYSPSPSCTVFSRHNISQADSLLYDSLLKSNAEPVFASDSFLITDTARVRFPYLTKNPNQFFPRYLQFKGSYNRFLGYILSADPSLDSIVTCGDSVRLYYGEHCEDCDSSFLAGGIDFPYQFYFYRYHEIYSAFFSFAAINKVEVFVSEENSTYLPSVGDLPVYAPNMCMQKKWYRRDIDYGNFFPVDFPSTVGGDFIVTEKDEFIWRETAANRWIR